MHLHDEERININLATFANPTIYDVRRDLFPLPKLPHILCSYLISFLDNLMMAHLQGRNM